MPDLDTGAMADWLGDFNVILDVPDDVGRLALEADGACEDAVTKFGQSLDRALDTDPQKLSETLRDDATLPLLGGVLARLSLARQARIVHWISAAGVPNGQTLIRKLAKPTDDGTGDAFRESMMILHRQDLLTRIFSQDRLTSLLAACRITAEELT